MIQTCLLPKNNNKIIKLATFLIKVYQRLDFGALQLNNYTFDNKKKIHQIKIMST